MASSVAGTIGGVAFIERPGSPTMNIQEGDATATRVLSIDWDQINTFLLAIIPPFCRSQGIVNESYKFALWPGSLVKDSLYRTKLVIKSIEIEPDWEGRQKELTTDSGANNGNIASYSRAKVTLTYGVDIEDKRRTEWNSKSSLHSVQSAYTFSSGDPATVQVPRPSEEIVTHIRVSELKVEYEREKDIASLETARLYVGTVNNAAVYFTIGTSKVLFPAQTLLFNSFEVIPCFRLGRIDSEIVYQFLVSPLRLLISDTSDGCGNWNLAVNEVTGHVESVTLNTDFAANSAYDVTPFLTSDFTKLFPLDWQLTSSTDDGL